MEGRARPFPGAASQAAAEPRRPAAWTRRLTGEPLTGGTTAQAAMPNARPPLPQPCYPKIPSPPPSGFKILPSATWAAASQTTDWSWQNPHCKGETASFSPSSASTCRGGCECRDAGRDLPLVAALTVSHQAAAPYPRQRDVPYKAAGLDTSLLRSELG